MPYPLNPKAHADAYQKLYERRQNTFKLSQKNESPFRVLERYLGDEDKLYPQEFWEKEVIVEASEHDISELFQLRDPIGNMVEDPKSHFRHPAETATGKRTS